MTNVFKQKKKERQNLFFLHFRAFLITQKNAKCEKVIRKVIYWIGGSGDSN